MLYIDIVNKDKKWDLIIQSQGEIFLLSKKFDTKEDAIYHCEKYLKKKFGYSEEIKFEKYPVVDSKDLEATVNINYKITKFDFVKGFILETLYNRVFWKIPVFILLTFIPLFVLCFVAVLIELFCSALNYSFNFVSGIYHKYISNPIDKWSLKNKK